MHFARNVVLADGLEVTKGVDGDGQPAGGRGSEYLWEPLLGEIGGGVAGPARIAEPADAAWSAGRYKGSRTGGKTGGSGENSRERSSVGLRWRLMLRLKLKLGT
jgi:hypothetical protein